MKNGGIVLVAFLFAIFFFAKPVLKMAIPNFDAGWGSTQEAGAAKFFNSGVEEQNKKNYEKAIEYYNKAVDVEKVDNDSCSYNALGKVYEETNDFNKATSNYLKAIELYPEDIEAYYNLGESFKKRFFKEKVS